MRALLVVFSIFLGLSYGINPEIINKLKNEASQIPKPKLSQEFQVKQIISSARVIYASYQKPIFVGNDLNQKDQEIIVLDALEDNVDTCGEKNTHVVLIRDGIDYRVLYAYIRVRGPNVFIEWERYTPRGGSSINKAYIFGHYACTKSLFTSCKTARVYQQLLNQKNSHIHDKRSQTLDFFCDLSNTQEEAMLSGAILSSLNMAVTILAGADVIYKDEVKYQKDLIHLIMEVKKKDIGRSFQIGSANALQNIAETAANKFMDKGRVALSTGVLMFYFLVGTIGQVAEALLHMDNKEIQDNPEYEEFKAEMRKELGMKILNGLFKGSYELGDNRVNPHPGYLLKETIAQIVAGKPATEVGEAAGRGLRGGNGNSGTRNYFTNNVRETESNRKGLRAVANLNAALHNAVGKGKDTKSAGQVFSENVRSGFHIPYGLAEDGGDAIGMLLGVGRINDGETIIDKVMDGIVGGASGILGGVVDVAADVLSPLGLGPLAKMVAGIGGGVLGVAAGASCEKVCGPVQLINLGAKLLFGGKKKKKPPPPEGTEDVEKKFLEMYYSQDPALEIPELAMQPPMVGIQQPPMAVGVVQPQMAVGVVQPQMAVGVPQPQMAIGVPQQPQMAVGVPQQPQMAVGVPQQPQMSYGQQQPQMGVGAPQQPQSGMSQPYPIGQMGQNQPGKAPPGLAPPGPGLTSLFGDMKKEDEGVHVQGLPLRMETQLELFSVWGWLSQDISVIKLSTFKTELDVFIGIGTANVVTVNNDKYSAPGTYNELINFFMLLLRIEYRDELRTQIVYLIQNNYIRYDDRLKVFYIVETAPILKERNLSEQEETYLYLSFELVAFSHSYKELVEYTLLLSSPNGQRLSKTAAVVQLMTMEYLSLVFKYGETHTIKLIRNYGLTVKTFFTKSMQDVYRYNTCWKCTSDLIGLADNNAMTMYGLLQFTLFGSWNSYLEAWAKQPRPNFEIPVIVSWYDAYFKAKYAEIVAQVSIYVV